MLKFILKFGIRVLVYGFLLCFIIAVIPKRIGSTRSPAYDCINNLRQIDAAADEFARENGKHPGDKINFPNDLTPFIKLNDAGKIPPCPSGGTYKLSRVGATPICSIGATVSPPHVMPEP